MKQKVIFLDVDGTLCNHKGIIPPSAIKACQTARKNGHRIFLSTGRSKAEIYDDMMNIGFDGVIGAAGGYIEIDGNMLRHIRMSQEQLMKLQAFFHQHQMFYIFESNSGLFCEFGTKEYIASLIQKQMKISFEEAMNSDFIQTLTECQNPLCDDVNKVAFLKSSLTIQEVSELFKNEFHIIPCTIPAFGELSGEIMIPNIHKADAIHELIQHLEVNIEDTIAIGDSVNDLEMLEYVHLGIAMGNASESVKAYADDITDSVDEDGLYKAFLKHGLI